jgi:large subunit ribosomal protein L10
LERKAKQKVMEELSEKLKAAKALVLVEYSGLNVAQTTRLRRELEKVNGEFKVAKNTLLRIASAGTQAEGIRDQFVGPNAVIYAYQDPVGIAKVLAGVAKDMPRLKVRLGLLGSQTLTPEDVVTLATLPSREALIAKLLGLMMQAGPQRLVNVLQGNLTKLAMVLNAIKTQKEAA